VNRATRQLIVNADDLGLCPGVNAGILHAHRHGIVTSASLMVLQPAAAQAVELAAPHPRLALGLHVDLGQWDYLAGEWVAAYVRCDQQDAGAVRAECRRQLDAFRGLLGRDPTHLDSHQHVHRSEPVATAMVELAAELGVPLRGRAVRYEGGFYGQTGKGEPLPQTITAQHLAGMIGGLEEGSTELGCHPGIAVAGESYGRERELEVQALCDQSVMAALWRNGVRLMSFAELGK
jgi:chitin disaccharide deacetylase